MFLFGTSPATAQQNTSTIHLGLETGSSLSFTGLNFNLAAKVEWRAHELYLGPKWVVSDTYLAGRGPWGLEAGYRWNAVEGKKMKAFAGLIYQAAFLKTGDPERKVRVQEGHLVYGFQWKVTRKWRIGNAIGIGGVVERSRINGTKAGDALTGFSLLFKIFAGYNFNVETKE